MMKVLKKTTKPRPRRGKRGKLTLELLLHWAYVWFTANNGRFCEPVRTTAPKLHVGKTKVNTLHDTLVTVGIMHVDMETVGRDANGKRQTLAYYVTTPDKAVLAFAHYWWALEAEHGTASPVRNYGLDETCVKTDSEPVRNDVHITTDNIVPLQSVVNSRSLHQNTVNSYGSVRERGQVEPVESKEISPECERGLDSPAAKLQAAYAKLAEFQEAAQSCPEGWADSIRLQKKLIAQLQGGAA